MKQYENYYEEAFLMHRVFNYLFLIPLIGIIILVAYSGASQVFVPKNIPLFIVAVIFSLLPLVMGRMTIEVKNAELMITYGYLGWIKRTILLSDIVSTEVVSYNPLRQFGGWGIRYGKFREEKMACFSLSGTKGLLITITSTVKACGRQVNKFIVGCKEPEKLQSIVGK